MAAGQRRGVRAACARPRVSSGIDEKFEITTISFPGWHGLGVGEDMLVLTPDGRRQLYQSAELADGIDRRASPPQPLSISFKIWAQE